MGPLAAVVGASPLAGWVAPDQGEVVFVLYLAVSVARVQQGRHVEMEAGLQRLVMEHPVAESVSALIPGLEAIVGEHLDSAEIGAVTEYWLGLDTVNEAAPLRTLDDGLLDVLLVTAGDQLHAALADDVELRAGLASHLERLVVRLRHGLPVHNPLLGEVRTRYPDVHRVARLLADQIEEQLGDSVAEDEVGFLTMYLSGAMERARLRPRRRVLVVCPSGMATAWVLVSRIQAEFPEFDLVEVLSEGSYESLDHADFDLVISTVPVRETAAPVVVVSPLLSAGDVKAVGIHS